MKTAKQCGMNLSHVESAASSAVKTMCDIRAKAIFVLADNKGDIVVRRRRDIEAANA